MDIESKGPFIKIQGSLIRVSKIDSVRIKHNVKANNFGRVSDGSYPEIIVSVGTDKHVFSFDTEAQQTEAFALIEQMITV